MSFSLRREAISLTLIAALFAASLWAFPQAPDRIPTHWGIDGQPDGWGGPGMLFLLPAVALGVWALTAFLPRLDPGRANYASFTGSYTLIRVTIVAFLALIHGFGVAAALGHTVNMGQVTAPATGILFILLGGVLGKIRPNWFVGVRTPWTLTSKLAWTRTHRATGFAFVAVGIVTLLAGMVSPTAGFVSLLVGALGTTAFSFVYSHHVWAHDPDRQSPGGTTPV